MLQIEFRKLSSITFEIAKNQRGEKQKSMFQLKIFNIYIFETFEKIEIGFSINLNKCF